MTERKLPPIIDIIKYMTCPDGHLHIIMMDKDKNELGELVLYDPREAREFIQQLAEKCVEAFVDGEVVEVRGEIDNQVKH